MGKKPGHHRGRLSNIDKLPEDIRVRINALLRERRIDQVDILEETNAELMARGLSPISKSSLGRYAVAVEKKIAQMREAREAANAMVGGLDEIKGTDLGRAVTEMIKTLAFTKIMKDGEDGQDLDVDTLNKLALLSQRIERASKMSLDREKDLKRQALEAAANAVDQTVSEGGLSDDAADMIRRQILGVRI